MPKSTLQRNADTSKNVVQKGKLYIVGTPIGNLGDVSKRAQTVLSTVDRIYCEDTRVTKTLLSAFAIHTPLERADENILANKVSDILENVRAGASVAFVSDAGMPGISDPGQRLVDAALREHVSVEVIPGPNAAVVALVASGIACDHFYFHGFLPRKDGERLKLLENLAHVPGALIFYESPHRAAKTLRDMAQVFPTREVALCRELTKLHEEVIRGTAAFLAEKYKGRDLKGECVIVVAAASADKKQTQELSHEQLKEVALQLLGEDAPVSQLAKKLAKQTGISRNEAYVLLLQLQS